jgi:hypothetical protein
MVNRKGELTSVRSIQAGHIKSHFRLIACTGARYDVVHDFGRGLSLCPLWLRAVRRPAGGRSHS